MAEAEDRTEAPTAKRRQEARGQGQVALSREVVMVAGLGAGTVMLMATGGPAASARALRRRPLLELRLDPAAASMSAGAAAAWAALPVACVACVAGIAAVLAQTGLLVRAAALQPDFGRVSPLRGAARVFGRQHLLQAGQALFKLLVLGASAWWGIQRVLPSLGAAPLLDVEALPAAVSAALGRVAMPVLGAQLALAALDAVWVRLKLTRSLRMSREEIKQESRESDGDPRVKARLRKLRMARARARMMAQVPKATVVVTNPTHYAVALAFDRAKQAAPRVVAKGADEVAARIREMAREHNVPLVSNPPLARALFRLELDTEIPAEHFQVVAEIIAYVWRLRGRVRG